MTDSVEIDGFLLTFQAGWATWAFDSSTFYRKHFQAFDGGTKAVDLLALSSEGLLWLVEVKDYRRQRRTKVGSVYDEVASKVIGTLAGIFAASVNANDPQELKFSQEAVRCNRIRVALLLAQSTRSSRLFPQVIDPLDAQDKLRRLLRAVDRRAICVSGSIREAQLPWQTRLVPAAPSRK